LSRVWEPADAGLLSVICGPNHMNLLYLEGELTEGELKAESQGGGIKLDGSAEAVATAELALSIFETIVGENPKAGIPALEGALSQARTPRQAYQTLTGLKVPIKPQTSMQAKYLDLLTGQKNDLIFGVGPAGTGKTFLAVAAGAAALKRPIWDALDETLGADQAGRMREKKIIEVAPLAFMRGRTLKNAFVLMDEAQNATVAQMKMVLTRLGRDSRMVVTGDPGQVDLPPKTQSGLAHALRILSGVEGVGRVTFSAKDVRRHALVSRIIKAYDADAKQPQ